MDVFQWLCACAVYPELQWGLTLTLGVLPSMPPGLVSEENLTKLLRLEWFRTGSIPDDRRLELISQLDPRIERDVREAIVHVLEDSPAPDETMAARAHSFQITYQRARLAPKDRKARANLKTALEDLGGNGREHAHSMSRIGRGRPALGAARALRKVFYPRACPGWCSTVGKSRDGIDCRRGRTSGFAHGRQVCLDGDYCHETRGRHSRSGDRVRDSRFTVLRRVDDGPTIGTDYASRSGYAFAGYIGDCAQPVAR